MGPRYLLNTKGLLLEGYYPHNSIINELYAPRFIIRRMQEEEMKAYQGLKKQGAFL